MANLILFQDPYFDEENECLSRFHSGHYEMRGFVEAVNEGTATNVLDERARPIGVGDILVDPQKMTLLVLGHAGFVEIPFVQSMKTFCGYQRA